VLGVDIPAEQVETILQHLGLQPEKTAEGFRVTAPSFRFDIEIEADLIEEIGRVYGYENIPDDYTSGRLKMNAAGFAQMVYIMPLMPARMMP